VARSTGKIHLCSYRGVRPRKTGSPLERKRKRETYLDNGKKGKKDFQVIPAKTLKRKDPFQRPLLLFRGNEKKEREKEKAQYTNRGKGKKRKRSLDRSRRKGEEGGCRSTPKRKGGKKKKGRSLVPLGRKRKKGSGLYSISEKGKGSYCGKRPVHMPPQ